MQQDTEESGGLTPAQEKAVVALLSCPTVELAAKKAGVNRVTLWRWQKEPAFIQALRIARQSLVDTTTDQLRGASTEAVSTLRELLKDADSAVRCRAANSLLTHTYRAHELHEVTERLVALEQAIAERDGTP